jgi:hypothetical protein
MNVTLNQNSWHFKIYSKIAGNTPPKTLCPYFWSLVAIVVLSPFLLIIYITGSTIEFFEKISKNRRVKRKLEDTRTHEEIMIEQRKKWDEEDRRETANMIRWNKITDVVKWTFKWIFLPIFIVGFIYVIFTTSTKIGWIQFLTGAGMVLLLVGVVVFFSWAIEKYGNRISTPIGIGLSKLNPIKWSVTQIIGGMIYSTYKKACPIIKWEGGEIKKDEYGTN